MPRISVIVPVYNVEKYLKRCIDSISEQTFSDFELLLIDDGSKDKSGEICDRSAEKDDRIKVLHKENGGASAARNTGIDIAVGEYIMFADSDDYIGRNMLESLLGLIERQNDWAISSIEMIEAGKHTKYCLGEKEYNATELLEEYCENKIPQICLCGPCAKLYKKSIIEKNKIRFNQELCVGEDTYFNMQYIKNCRSIATTGEIYYYYMRENADSLFSKFRPYYYENTKVVYEYTLQTCQVANCAEKAKNALTESYVGSLLGNFYKATMTTDKQTSKEFMQKMQKDIVFQKNINVLRKNWKQYIIGVLIRKKRYKTAYLITLLWNFLKQ